MDDWLDKIGSDKADYEARMRKQHRCRACGVKLKPFPRSKPDEPYWPLECEDCRRTAREPMLPLRDPLECEDCRRTAREPMLPLRDRFGSAQASLHHELQRRMGYSCAQAAPDMGDEE